jgi:hypothetical protein
MQACFFEGMVHGLQNVFHHCDRFHHRDRGGIAGPIGPRAGRH